jgi:glutathione peroxidase
MQPLPASSSAPAWAALALCAACSAEPAPTPPPARESAATPVAAHAEAPETAPATETDPMYDIPIATLDGKPTDLSAYRGKALLVVNVASKCGLTPQYKGLQQLHDTYAARGFEVVGFPCNQFKGQEPGTPEEIQTFCSTNYGVTFPLMAKLEVNGKARHALYGKLTAVPDANGEAGDVQWNFEKFLVHPGGKKIQRFRPKTTPEDPTLVAAIEAALPN